MEDRPDIVLYRDYELDAGEIVVISGHQVRVVYCEEVRQEEAARLRAQGFSPKSFKIIVRPANRVNRPSQADPEIT